MQIVYGISNQMIPGNKDLQEFMDEALLINRNVVKPIVTIFILFDPILQVVEN